MQQPLKINLYRWQWHPNYTALVFAIAFLCISLLPSLLPRPWWLQGVITGSSMALGYGLGQAVSALARWFLQYEPSGDTKYKARLFLRIISPLLIILFLLLGRMWQNEVRTLLDVEPIGLSYIYMLILVSAAVFTVLLLAARTIHFMSRKIRSFYHRYAPPRLGTALGLITTFLLLYYLISGILFSTFLETANNIFSNRDNIAPEGIEQPVSFSRSGSPNSLIPWSELGYQGQKFVGGGPEAEDIADYTGEQALEPIRVYAGLASAGSVEERARLALEELRRTDAFERDVLVVATATGTGWLEPTTMAALEYMHGGDTAIVSQQYSYLPSWISLLAEQEAARETGQALYDTLIEEWDSLPEDSRPELIAYGLSLGSYGAQSAFSGVNDIRRSVDGALFVGTPNNTDLWRTITRNRDENSPEWQPVYRDGRTVRFAASKEDVIENQEVWHDTTRILYIQHASDPVVWFSPELIFNKPDWLDEPRGPDVSAGTRWYPLITFMQVGLDLTATAPEGHGHDYADMATYAWGSIVPPEDWGVEDSEELQEYLMNNVDSD